MGLDIGAPTTTPYIQALSKSANINGRTKLIIRSINVKTKTKEKGNIKRFANSGCFNISVFIFSIV